jgi:hypothetical protein
VGGCSLPRRIFWGSFSPRGNRERVVPTGPGWTQLDGAVLTLSECHARDRPYLQRCTCHRDWLWRRYRSFLPGQSGGRAVLPQRTQNRILPWVYLAPAALVLTAYLALPTVLTVYISFFDRRSQNWVWLANYIDLLTDKVMWEAFRNNILWLVLVTGISVSLGLVIAVLADRVKYEQVPKTLIFSAYGHLLRRGQRHLAVCL